MVQHVDAGVYLFDFDNKLKLALYIKKQKPPLNKHLLQHDSSFLLNVF